MRKSLKPAGLLGFATMVIASVMLVGCDQAEPGDPPELLDDPECEVPPAFGRSGETKASAGARSLRGGGGSYGDLFNSRLDRHVDEEDYNCYGLRASRMEGVYTTVLFPNDGDSDLELWYWSEDTGWEYAGIQSINSGQEADVIRIDTDDLPSWVEKVYFCVYGYEESDYDVLFYRGYANEDISFTPTVITARTSSSVYALDRNAFWVTATEDLRGQCTWYVYGRVVELVDYGELDEDAEDTLYDAFWGESGRDAANWPAMIGGRWDEGDELDDEDRRPGLIVVFPAAAGGVGHVAFVEEVNDDLTMYRYSDFNGSGDLRYRSAQTNGWKRFGSPVSGLGSEEPVFYVLPLE